MKEISINDLCLLSSGPASLQPLERGEAGQDRARRTGADASGGGGGGNISVNSGNI